MYFGGTPFAASPFGDPGFNPNAFVNVTGSRINESTGTVSLVGKANFAVTGSRVNFSIGNTTIIEGVGVIVTPDGSRVNITTGDPTNSWKSCNCNYRKQSKFKYRNTNFCF